MKHIITMSMKETERIAIMDKLVAKLMKQKHASRHLGISIRQVQRMVKRYKREGVSGLTHLSRGQIGNRAFSLEKKEQVIALLKKQYPDFGPTFASEKLLERDSIAISKETVRKLMIDEGLWKAHVRKHIVIHTYRDRRPCVGELIQLDGSNHKWFEERGPRCTLIAYIDDATSRIMDGEFADYEGTFTLFSATEHYLLQHGKPLSFYVDKHSTYRINRQATVDEELRDFLPQSQFGRAMGELRIEVIFANSSEAKGRIERLFETLQDRLVKELRLEGISTKEEATKYFREVYIPRHNAKFAELPQDSFNTHRAMLPSENLSRIFTVQTKRIVSNVLVVQYKNTRFQLDTTGQYRYLLKKATVLIEESKVGEIVIRHKDEVLPYKVIGKIIKHPTSKQVASAKSFQERQVQIQAKDPWATPITAAL